MGKLTISNTEKFSVERKVISYMTTKSWQTIPHVSYIGAGLSRLLGLVNLSNT